MKTECSNCATHKDWRKTFVLLSIQLSKFYRHRAKTPINILILRYILIKQKKLLQKHITSYIVTHEFDKEQIQGIRTP